MWEKDLTYCHLPEIQNVLICFLTNERKIKERNPSVRTQTATFIHFITLIISKKEKGVRNRANLELSSG